MALLFLYMKCIGWWQQGSVKCEMEHLYIYIKNGKINGSGIDLAGTFTFEGSIAENGGPVEMIKQYTDAHQVRYRGMFDGKRVLTGSWSMNYLIWSDSGPWEILLPETEKAKKQLALVEELA